MSPTSGTHIVHPTAPHTHTIIFLHGRGSNAKTFCEEIFESQDSRGRFLVDIFPSIKWVFPCAKKQWAVKEGEEMHQWFDMTCVHRPWEEEEIQRPGLCESASRLLDVINIEASVIGARNIILAGISQGCATAIHTLIKSKMHLGGFIGLSGWGPLLEEVNSGRDDPGKVKDVFETPVLLQHCKDDDVVFYERGVELREQLCGMQMMVRWEEFEEGGHWLNEPEGVDSVVRFVDEIIELGESDGWQVGV